MIQDLSKAPRQKAFFYSEEEKIKPFYHFLEVAGQCNGFILNHSKIAREANMIFCLFTFFVFSDFSSGTEIRSVPKQLPAFDEMSEQPSSARKQYLKHLVRLINEKEYGFLDEIILTPGKRQQKHCFSGIYGDGHSLKNLIKPLVDSANRTSGWLRSFLRMRITNISGKNFG